MFIKLLRHSRQDIPHACSSTTCVQNRYSTKTYDMSKRFLDEILAHFCSLSPKLLEKIERPAVEFKKRKPLYRTQN